jgi:hypothetical protein
MGEAARRRAVEELAYDRLIARLAPVAAGTLADLPSLPR